MTGSPARAHVIGMGEVGRRLAGALERAGVQVVRVTRHEGWEGARTDPSSVRILCMREEDLPAALEMLPGVPPGQIVAVQNGWIRPLLEAWPGCGRGLIWFMSKGEFFNELRPSIVTGPAGAWLADALSRGGLRVTFAGDAAEFAKLEADKMGFNCVVGLPLAVHGVTLGQYLDERSDEARAVFTEAVTVSSRALGVEPSPSAWPKFVQTVEPIRWVAPSRAKALDYRNGAIVRLAR
ncbi:MAG: hypothetical protein GXP48_06560, partial [Acidobacteria bacterium]|nr:hypothetical protein [Acidobacteriota bacterium]